MQVRNIHAQGRIVSRANHTANVWLLNEPACGSLLEHVVLALRIFANRAATLFRAEAGILNVSGAVRDYCVIIAVRTAATCTVPRATHKKAVSH